MRGFVLGLVGLVAVSLANLSCRGPATWGDVRDSKRDLTGAVAVFPGAEGFGTDTRAGRGGRVLRVTTLADGGPGSLREALAAAGPRVVAFEVGGTIRAGAELEIREPFVTVAGQTAPSPGISIAGAGIIVRTHDVLLQHLRVRVGDGDAGAPKDRRRAIHMVGERDGSLEVFNVVVDHCSAGWATDECVTTWYPGVHDVTVSRCIVSEGLSHAGHPKGEHSKGMLVGDYTKRFAAIGNLFASNRDRNPRMKSDTSTLLVNNVSYNHGVFPVMIGGRDVARGPSRAAIVGNVFRPGPSTEFDSVIWMTDVPPGTEVFAHDNLSPQAGTDGWALVQGEREGVVRATTPPVWVEPLTVLPARDVLEVVLAGAGARPADRDAVDRRIVAEVRGGGGRIIDSQRDAGGWPELPETRRTLEQAGTETGLPFPGDPHAGAPWTNLERWLHVLALRVEGR